MRRASRGIAMAACAGWLAQVACSGGGAETHAISGTVVGPQGVTIALTGAASATAITDASGNYAFTGLSNGSYTLAPSMTQYGFSPTTRIVILGDTDVTAQDLTAAAEAFSVRGTATGAIQEGVAIALTGAASATTITDASGDYSFPGLPAGNYTLTPSMSGYCFSPESRNLWLFAGDVTAQDFAAGVWTDARAISGTVEGLAGATITLLGPSGATTTTTDASGSYSFSGVSSGSYTIAPSGENLAFTPANRPVSVCAGDAAGQDFAWRTYHAPQVQVVNYQEPSIYRVDVGGVPFTENLGGCTDTCETSFAAVATGENAIVLYSTRPDLPSPYQIEKYGGFQEGNAYAIRVSNPWFTYCVSYWRRLHPDLAFLDDPDKVYLGYTGYCEHLP